MGARNRYRNRVVVPARQADGIDSLESIHGLLKSLKIPSQISVSMTVTAAATAKCHGTKCHADRPQTCTGGSFDITEQSARVQCWNFRTIYGGPAPARHSASLCSLAGWYGQPIPTLDCSQIQALLCVRDNVGDNPVAEFIDP
jgi:hypothetical protein